MSEHTRLTEAEIEWLGWVVYEGAPSRDDMLGKLEAVARRIKADAYAAGLAARTSTATADTDRPAYGDVEAWKDNYDGMFQRWAECDTERLALKEEVRTLTLRLRIVEQDTATADTGLRERVARAEALLDSWDGKDAGSLLIRVRGALADPSQTDLFGSAMSGDWSDDATPASTEDRADWTFDALTDYANAETARANAAEAEVARLRADNEGTRE